MKLVPTMPIKEHAASLEVGTVLRYRDGLIQVLKVVSNDGTTIGTRSENSSDKNQVGIPVSDVDFWKRVHVVSIPSDAEKIKELKRTLVKILSEVEHKRGGPEKNNLVSAQYIYQLCCDALDRMPEPQKWSS